MPSRLDCQRSVLLIKLRRQAGAFDWLTANQRQASLPASLCLVFAHGRAEDPEAPATAGVGSYLA